VANSTWTLIFTVYTPTAGSVKLCFLVFLVFRTCSRITVPKRTKLFENSVSLFC